MISIGFGDGWSCMLCSQESKNNDKSEFFRRRGRSLAKYNKENYEIKPLFSWRFGHHRRFDTIQRQAAILQPYEIEIFNSVIALTLNREIIPNK